LDKNEILARHSKVDYPSKVLLFFTFAKHFFLFLRAGGGWIVKSN